MTSRAQSGANPSAPRAAVRAACAAERSARSETMRSPCRSALRTTRDHAVMHRLRRLCAVNSATLAGTEKRARRRALRRRGAPSAGEFQKLPGEPAGMLSGGPLPLPRRQYLGLAAFGASAGPLVDAVHNQALLTYDILPVSIPLGLGVAKTSLLVPPLLAVAYALLGFTLPRLAESVVGHARLTSPWLDSLKSGTLLALHGSRLLPTASPWRCFRARLMGRTKRNHWTLLLCSDDGCHRRWTMAGSCR